MTGGKRYLLLSGTTLVESGASIKLIEPDGAVDDVSWYTTWRLMELLRLGLPGGLADDESRHIERRLALRRPRSYASFCFPGLLPLPLSAEPWSKERGSQLVWSNPEGNPRLAYLTHGERRMARIQHLPAADDSLGMVTNVDLLDDESRASAAAVTCILEHLAAQAPGTIVRVTNRHAEVADGRPAERPTECVALLEHIRLGTTKLLVNNGLDMKYVEVAPRCLSAKSPLYVDF